MKRKQIWLKIETYLLADKLRGNKTFNDIILKALKNIPKVNELKLEIERLRSEKAAEVPESHQTTAHKSLREPKLSLPQPPQNPLEIQCHYHAYNPQTGKHYCDGKEIDPYVCLNRYQRFAHFEKNCYPKGMKFKRRRRKGAGDKEEKWHAKAGNIFKGYEESGEW